jgi:hypothetical protein
LSEAVRPVIQLVDRLAVVIAGEFAAPDLTVDVTPLFERGGEGIDIVEIGTQKMLAFLHGSIHGVERLVEVSRSTEGFCAAQKNGNEIDCGSVHNYLELISTIRNF